MHDPTWILALSTVALAAATVYLAIVSRQGTSRQIGIQTWLALETRFDSAEMKQARKIFAAKCRPYKPSMHDHMSEEVLDLFESIGTVYNQGFINKTLADSSFSWYANRWWEAAKPYIDEERRRKGGDETLFEEFEKYVKEIRKSDPKITSDDLNQFLADEMAVKSMRISQDAITKI